MDKLNGGQIQALACGVMLNGVPLTPDEIRVIHRGLRAYRASNIHPDERERAINLMDGLNQILIERG